MILAELDRLIGAGYPRPRLVRPEWQELNGPWEFDIDEDDRGLEERWWRDASGRFEATIEVPFPPESRRSGVENRSRYAVVWYRRRLAVHPRLGRRLLLHFGAVDYAATVWVNGSLVARHVGGHTPFSADITDEVSDHGSTVVVRAEDRPLDPHQPRGKQDWEEHPHRIWYHRTTGIWQPVWLEEVPNEHIVGCSFSIDLARATVTAEIEVRGRTADHRLGVRLLLGDEVLGEADQGTGEGHVRVPVPLPILENAWAWAGLCWSPESPTLLAVELVLTRPDGVVADRAWSYVGLRSIETKDGRFLLNGQPEYLRLVLSQGYWPESHLAAPSARALREEVELVASLGFNGVRVRQKIEDPRLLYWADRLGLMVWEEMPSAAAFSFRAARRTLVEWAEAIARDRDHPSVVTWVAFNESWGLPDLARSAPQQHLAAAAYHLTRALDPTRPVISNDGWEHVESDIHGVHDYSAHGDELARRYGTPDALAATLHDRWPAARRVLLDGAPERGQPVVLSEFGGVALSAESDQVWHGYSSAQNEEVLAERLGELFASVRGARDLAGFCYTQLVDTEQEENGLCWPDRNPKLEAKRVRAIVTGKE